MRYATAAAFRTALEQRLLTEARQQDVPLVRLRKLVAFERLLARLMVAAPDRWVLKGAVALHFRLGARFRTTKDLDLGRWDHERVATDDLLATERVALGDYFRFAVERTAKLDELLEGAAVRYHVTSYLAGRRFEELTLDIASAIRYPESPSGCAARTSSASRRSRRRKSRYFRSSRTWPRKSMPILAATRAADLAPASRTSSTWC